METGRKQRMDLSADRLTTDAITFRELKGVEYVYVTKYTHGKESKEVLTGLADVIKSLTFPVTMHWAEYDFEYIRPIHWIVALLDDEVIPFEILDVKHVEPLEVIVS